MKAVITFHGIDDTGSVLSFPPTLFERLVDSLQTDGIQIVSLPDLCGGADGVVLCFDDGMKSVRSKALPILLDAGIPAHIFLTTDAVGGDNSWPTQPAGAQQFQMMNWDDVDACVAGGLLIENHTHTHPFLTRCSQAKVIDECATSDAIIEQRTGRKPKAFAYPYGDFDNRVVEIIRPRYSQALTTALDFFRPSCQLHQIPRLDSYYLRHGWLIQNLSGQSVSVYIGLRRLLRRLRGH